MASVIADNQRIQLVHLLREHAPRHKSLSIATGYWDLPGLHLIIDSIKDYESVRLLIGQEPLAPQYASRLDIHELEATFPESNFKSSLEALEPGQDMRATALKLKQMIDEGRFEVKVFRGSFLHAKTYIFGGFNSKDMFGVIGSSNFTEAGLSRNLELNISEDDVRILKSEPKIETDSHGHLSWFNSIWENPASEIWTGKFTEIVRSSPLGDMTYSPYEMYIRSLYEVYGEELIPEVDYLGTTSDVLFQFQKRNSSLLLSKLQRHGLAMLADSVGLGKTITAGEVVKHYIRELDARRVYIIAPANLVDQWKSDLYKVHELYSGYEIISMQDLASVQKQRHFDQFKSVDLFVIDEAHNLRNGSGARYEEFLDWFSANQESHVLLLTATPINNSLKDFVNQIQLAAKGRLESFPVIYPTGTKNITLDFFEAVERLESEHNKALNRGEKPDYEKAKNIMRQGLSRFLVRTTRQGIEREFGGISRPDGRIEKFPQSEVRSHKYFFNPSLMPKIKEAVASHRSMLEGLNPLEFSVEGLLSKTQRTQHPFDDLSQIPKTSQPVTTPFEAIFQTLLMLGFTPYRAEVYKHQYYGKDVESLRNYELKPEQGFKLNSQLSIHNIMRVTLLKRLESSQWALKRSLEKYLERIAKFRAALIEGYVVTLRELDEITQTYGDDLDSAFDEAQSAREEQLIPADAAVYNLEAMSRDLDRDEKLVQLLLEMCEHLGRNDDKLEAFATMLRDLRLNSSPSEKLLVFSYFADTIEYLRNALPSLLPEIDFTTQAGFTTGSNKKDIEVLARRFSPDSKGATDQERSSELTYLFATDVLSEGQNLQDCATLVNFDLHWNPVRMIQRNGRINRLGSRHERVRIFNMRPEVNLDQYLALVSRLELKIEKISSTVGTDASVLGEAENPIEFISDLYDDAKSSELLTKLEDDQSFLSEDEFIRDLREFEASASSDLKERVLSIPSGKWGYFASVAKVPKNIRSLGLIRVNYSSGLSSGLKSAAVFVSQTDTFQAIPTIEALQMVKATPSDHQYLEDNLQIDRPDIADKSHKVAQRHAATIRPTFPLTASQKAVLDRLAASAPQIRVSDALTKITTKPEKAFIKKVFLQASRELSQRDHLSEAILREFETAVRALEDKPSQAKTVESSRAVMFFAKH